MKSSARRPLSRALALLLLAAAAPAAHAQIFRNNPPVEVKPNFGPMREDRGTDSRVADLLKVSIRLKLDEKAETFAGSVVNDVSFLVPGAKEIWFDAEEMKVTAAKVDGKEAPFRHENGRVTVTLPAPAAYGQRAAIELDYEGAHPHRGLYFIHPTKEDPSLLDEIWTQGESEDNRRWVPTWDYPSDRATFEGEYTVRDGLTVVSNGKLLDRKPAEAGWTTWHYALDFPFATYLLSLCVGHYERYADDWRGIPVEYYVQQGVGEAKARRSFHLTPDAMEFFSSRIGVPYPYPKYSQTCVQHFVAGGMENISATTQTDTTLHDEREELDRDSQGLMAHELAHQWFGDYLTCRTWSNLWLNEGFADFFEALYREHHQGEDDFRLEMRNEQRSAIGMDNRATRPIVESFFNRAPQGDGNNAVYVRGSSALHMIRTQLGDEAWWKAIHHYVTRYAGQLVDTHDFENAIEEATGRNLHWLFEEFVYLGGHPKFTVTQSWDKEKKEVVLNVKQTQDTANMVPVFAYPVPIEVVTSEGRKTHEVWIEKREQEVRLPAPSQPIMVAFDSGNALLKEIEFKKGTAELAFIAQGGDSDAVARIMAVEQLPDSEDKAQARAALASVLASKDHEQIRAAAADGLAKIGGAAVGPALLAAVKDGSPRERRSAVAALGRVAGDLGDARGAAATAVAEALRTDLSYSVQQTACAALGELGGDDALVALRAATDLPSPNDRTSGAALRARIALDDGMAIDEVFQMASAAPGSDPHRRARGLQALGGLSGKQFAARREPAVALLLAAAQEQDDSVLRAAVQAIGELKVVEAEDVLRKLSERRDGPRFLGFVVRNALRQIDEEKKRVAAAEQAPAPAAVPTNEELARTVSELQKQIEALKAEVERLKRPAGAGAVGAGGGG